MPKELIFEGRTTTEAIEKGLKELKVSKDKVEITVLEAEEKRSFFSILAPRVVKVKMVLKEEKINKKKESTKRKDPIKYEVSEEELQKAKEATEKFLNEFLQAIKKEITSKTEIKDSSILVTLEGENASEFIGYRGEVLNALQSLLSTIANKDRKGKIKLILDIANYKEKREKTLEDLAVKVAKSVVKTGKSITLEPMTAYERKIIHSKLQENSRVTTYSVGEEPHRRIVIQKNK